MIKNQNGQWVKENPEVTERLERQSRMLKESVKRANAMQDLKDHPGWLAVKAVFDQHIKTAQDKLDTFKKNDQRTNDLLMQELADFRIASNVVEDHIGSVEGMELMIEKCEKELDERAKQRRDHAPV